MKTDYLPTLHYRQGDQFAPIPPSEQGLQTITAELFVPVGEESLNVLEGVCFDRTGDNLYFVDCLSKNAVMKVDMKTKEVSTVIAVDDTQVSAVKIHKDGRLFVACCSDDWIKPGQIFACNPDGSNRQVIVSEADGKGFVVNDMVFDSKGGFYFSDFIGWTTDPKGGVYYVSPDFKTITPVITNMAAANGVSLSKDEKVLWVSEILAGRIIRVDLAADGISYGAFATSNVYTTTGYLGPDSIYVDDDDNVYCALFGQGRILVFNRNGFPIGQILMPGREEGLFLKTTHATIRPGTRELYICSAGDSGEGTAIFKAGAFAIANTNSFTLQ